MHSHDRTLLASLGFADPDKKDRRHDLGCRYMARPESFRALTERVTSQTFDDPKLDSYNIDYRISKGIGQYETTIGFVDVVLWGSYLIKEERRDLRVMVEVKVNPVPVGDMIRQIGLYRAHLASHITVMACAFPLTESEIRSLRNEKIWYAYLGEGFDRYCDEQDKESAPEASARFEL